jgi:hypothetical protein
VRLADAVLRLPHNDRHGEILFEAVREGLWPFKPHMIQAYMEYDIDFHRYWIYFEVVFKDGQRIAHKEKVDAWDMADQPYTEVNKLYPKFLAAFRNREDDPIPSNIVLGEQ